MKTPPAMIAAALLALSLLTFSACTTVGETGRKQLNFLSADEEKQMGLSSFEEVKKQEKVSTDKAANERVSRVGKRIAEAVGGGMPDAQWEFVVFDSETVNAFALPGGKVGVYTGLLKLAATDDELAIVMGHEIAHVTSHHGAERVSQQTAANAVGALLAGYAQSKGVSANTLQIAQTAYGAGANLGVLLPFSRAHETEADTIGIQFAAKAGYDPKAGAVFWKKMPASGTGVLEKFTSTHPQNADRIANLEKLAPQWQATYEAARKKYEGK
jgi:predicted Zn-dependent protease